MSARPASARPAPALVPVRSLSALGSLVCCAAVLLTLLTAPARAGSTGPDTSDTASDTASDTEPDTAPPTVSSTARHRQRTRLVVLPQVVQHGRRAAPADAARSALVATVRPVRVGRVVQLQLRQDDAWRTVARSRQNRSGRAQFAAAATTAGEPSVYRVRAQRVRGLRPVTSGRVSTERWLHPTWAQEFAGDRLDPVWSHRGLDYAHGSRRSCAKGDPRATRVGDGVVRLSVVLDPDATKRCRVQGRDQVRGRFAYRLNGHIGTEGAYAFRYGIAAARVRFQQRRGQHGAFWMQAPGGIYPGAAGNEIDVVEYFGDRHPQGGLATFVHRYDGRRRATRGGWIPDSRRFLASRRDGWSKSFHVFSVEWRPRMLIFRIDGRETARMRGVTSDVRQFVVLSLIAANYEIPKIAERHLPQHMDVDWVRVWETGG